MDKRLNSVVEILKSENHGLKQLAILSGRDEFRFYNGADLSGLDLSKQDLTGLNFDGADLQFANLDGAHYDEGSFNRSLLDDELAKYKDEFIFNIHEVVEFPNDELQAFVKIRPGLIDQAIRFSHMNLDQFAHDTGISLASLRKTRNVKIVAMETAQRVFQQCMRLVDNGSMANFPSFVAKLNQPCAAIVVGGNNNPFRSIDHAGINKLLLIRLLRQRDYVKTYHKEPPSYLRMRDTADYLRYSAHLLDREDLLNDY